MAGLRQAVAEACSRPALAGLLMWLPRRTLVPPLGLRLHQRLGRMMQEFAALFAHLTEFGADAPPRPPRRKPAPRPDVAASPAPDAPPDTPQTRPQGTSWVPAAARPESPPRPPRLPGNVGWLTGLSPAAAAGASQLRHLLMDPEVLDLLRASPALVRMLRPLCRMLGVDLPVEFLPPKPANAEPKPPRRRRRRLWRPPSRRSDMLLLLRMGTPLRES